MTETIANRMKPKFLKNDVLSITALEYYKKWNDILIHEIFFVLTKMIAELKQNEYIFLEIWIFEILNREIVHREQ